MNNLVRAIAEDGSVVCCAIDSTAMVAAAERHHLTSATVTAAMGRLITAASMMGSMLKDTSDSVTLRLAGDGPMGVAIAVAGGDGHARCYVTNPIVEIPLNAYGKLDVAGAVGSKGFLTVMRDVGLPEPMTGHSPLVSGEVAEDITYYYAMSEQIPTVCSLGVLVDTDLSVKAAGGFLIQLLPGADDAVIERVEQNIKSVPSISAMVDSGMTAWEIAERMMDGFSPQLLDERTAEYRCNCSRERVERALISLGRDELEKMALEEDTTEVACHFCNIKYSFSRAALKKLLDEAV